jgi:hypothetical protein
MEGRGAVRRLKKLGNAHIFEAAVDGVLAHPEPLRGGGKHVPGLSAIGEAVEGN